MDEWERRMKCEIDKTFKKGIIGNNICQVIWFGKRWMIEIYKFRVIGIGWRIGFSKNK
jgi:hypothetical protein